MSLPSDATTEVNQPGEITTQTFADALGIAIAASDREAFAATLERIAELEKQADAKAAHVQLH